MKKKKIVVILDLFDLPNIYFILFSFILTASNDGTIVVTDLTNPSQPTRKHTLTGHKVGNRQILTKSFQIHYLKPKGLYKHNFKWPSTYREACPIYNGTL